MSGTEGLGRGEQAGSVPEYQDPTVAYNSGYNDGQREEREVWQRALARLLNRNEGIVMASITVKFKDGTKREFTHEGRADGSYTKTVKYEGGAVIIQDEWYRRNAFPLADVAEVIETPEQY